LIAAYREVWEGARQPAEAIRAIRASTRFGISGASPERLRRPDWKPQGGKRPATTMAPRERKESIPHSSTSRSSATPPPSTTPRSSTPRRSSSKTRDRRTR
jgi:hypothetical protein